MACSPPQTQKARTDGPNEHGCADAHQQMRYFDQPVQVAYQDHLLRDAKNWQNERIDDTYGSQPSQPAGENCHHGQDQQCEGNKKTKEHMMLVKSA